MSLEAVVFTQQVTKVGSIVRHPLSSVEEPMFVLTDGLYGDGSPAITLTLDGMTNLQDALEQVRTKYQPVAVAAEPSPPSIQDLYLELIRRTTFNACDGNQIAHDLEQTRDLWNAAIMVMDGRPGFTLRDMRRGSNVHTVDTLYVVCPSLESARGIAALATTWGVDDNNIDMLPANESAAFLGVGRPLAAGQVVVKCWWD